MLIFLILLMMGALQAEEPHHTTAFIRPCDFLVSYSRYDTDHFWNKNEKRLPTYNTFKQNSYTLYFEYALMKSSSLFFNGGYSTVQESMNGSSQAVEDLELGWKHLLKETHCSALTVKLTTIIPAGFKKASIRYGKWGFEVAFLYSLLLKEAIWIDSGIGFRAYAGYPSDQVRAFVSLGYQWTYFALIATGCGEYGIFNGNADGNWNNIVFNANYRLIKGKLECLITPTTHFSMSLGGFYHFWGQNHGTGEGYFCGAWLNF